MGGESPPDLVEWVREVWVPGDRVQQQKDDHPTRLEFQAWAMDHFLSHGIDFAYVKTWVVCQKEEEGEGYIDGHPHVHYPLTATTLVHYLTEGAPIFIEGKRVDPYPGLTLMFSNSTKHGVYKHKGADRLALIATAI